MPFPSDIRGTVGTSKGFCGRGSVVFSGDAGRGTDIWSCWFSFAVCTSKINICAASFFFSKEGNPLLQLYGGTVWGAATPVSESRCTLRLRPQMREAAPRGKQRLFSLFSIWCSYCLTFCFIIWISCLCPCAAHMRGCLATIWIWWLNAPFIQKAPFTCRK